MKTLTGKEFAKAIEKEGWVLLRIHGSHHIYGKSGVDARISIPVHGNQPLKAGLQRHLTKVAGLKELI